MQKARRHVITTLRPLVGRRVQGLFPTPCSGFFSPFPHGTGSLSVSREYLALRDGPRSFTQDFSCPALLRIPLGFNRQSCTGVSPSMTAFSKAFHFTLSCHVVVLQPRVALERHGFGLFRVRSPLLTESLFIFSSYGYLDVSVPHVRLPYGMAGLQPAGLPHSDIPDQRLFAPPRAFRSLSRPSSPPRAKASTVCPCLLSLTSYIRTG